jgi:hypothetical protein
VTAAMTVTHATVSGLTTRIETLGHKFCMDNFFSLPGLFGVLHMKAKNCYCTIAPNQKGMPVDFRRQLRLKWCDMKTRVRDDLTAIVWKEKKYKHVEKYGLFSSRR